MSSLPTPSSPADTGLPPAWDVLGPLLAPVDASARLFARRLARTVADGDDLYHEALLRALAKLPTLRDPARFRPWLFQVILNVHRSRARRGFWRRLVSSSDDAAPLPEAADLAPVALAEHRAGADRAARALAALPAVQREAIVLHELSQFTVEEVAELQGCSVSAVKSRLVRGRASMRAFYATSRPRTPTEAVHG